MASHRRIVRAAKDAPNRSKRWTRRCAVAAAFLCLILPADQPGPEAAPARVIITIYDDGDGCPGGCDAHVVFHGSMNGTEFAHAPGGTVGNLRKCARGKTCTVCLEGGSKQCLDVIYRGAGPDRNRLDFTPRFYQAACAEPPAQPALAAQCRRFAEAAKVLAKRVNCILDSGDRACTTFMPAAIAGRNADRSRYKTCSIQGATAYNRGKPAAEQRSEDCAYERVGTGGPNSNGEHWTRLLPGTCPDGSFVGKDGLDCCSGVLLTDGGLGRECANFYPEPAP